MVGSGGSVDAVVAEGLAASTTLEERSMVVEGWCDFSLAASPACSCKGTFGFEGFIVSFKVVWPFAADAGNVAD